ncbi:MAG: HEAT repeat domain-containing protein [Planctomycetota bacterium]|nr:HEAT repeat domain-containing protein [Planctomycetota bacterium]MDA1177391.1 HEAT repeat domain-containing protein [Planctomycetota bacterium]
MNNLKQVGIAMNRGAVAMGYIPLLSGELPAQLLSSAFEIECNEQRHSAQPYLQGPQRSEWRPNAMLGRRREGATPTSPAIPELPCVFLRETSSRNYWVASGSWYAQLQSSLDPSPLTDSVTHLLFQRPLSFWREQRMRWLAVLGFLWVSCALAQAEVLTLQPGDHICVIGNGFAERMQHDGWLETFIHNRFPDHHLVFRNLAVGGDEIGGWKEASQRMRSMSFGSQDEWLGGNAPVPQPAKLSPRDEGKVRENRLATTNTNADVIFAFFGYNESSAGESGLDRFKANVDAFLKHTLEQKYNGRTAPRIVLFSPWPQEHIDDPNLPSRDRVDTANRRMRSYAAVMKDVAAANHVLFVDLHALGSNEMNTSHSRKQALTINGIHLNEAGHRLVATVMHEALFAEVPPDTSSLETLRKAVNDKNWMWFHRYRTTDGFSTYGDRAFLKFSEGPGGYGEGLSNYSVQQRELEVLDVMTSNRDRVVWEVARGNRVQVQDDNLPEFIPVISNTPGSLPDGRHEFLSGAEAIDKMTVGKGLAVTLFADEKMFPELVNPVQMAFDTRGRLWVTVWRTYPHWKPTEAMADKLLILEDTDQDGTADRCQTFAGDLHNPTGFEFWNGGVFVAQGPDILFLKDTNNDDQYDVKERVLHGLDTADTHHTANSFTMDPGGSLYFQEGTFHQTQIETPWGAPRRVADAAVFRFEPRTCKIDVYVSFGFANPHGHVFDRWGQDIVYDGTGADPYHALLFSGDIDFPHKHARPPTVYAKRTRPCSGVEILNSGHFPEEFRGNLLVNNVIGFQGMLRYRVDEKDSSITATELEPIVASSDPNFRPADVEVAPDGSIYFTDWQNPIIGHMQHHLRDPSRDREHGRVYRIRCSDRELIVAPPVAGQPLASLLELLKSNDDRTRYRVRIELSSRPTDQVVVAVQKWLELLDPQDADVEHHRLEALWLHQSHNIVDVELLKQVLQSPDYRARAAATRVLAYWRDRVPDALELLRTQIADDHPGVRLQAIWALSFFGEADAEEANDVLVESLIYPQDDFIKLVFQETTKTLERRMKAETESTP